MTPGARLRQRLAAGPILVVPGAYDALFARLVESSGFEAVYLTGSGVSYSTLAAPDIGLVTADAMAAKVRELSAAVDVPIIADADTGYGDEANIARTVREYERGGAAAIQIEDQVAPKRCGHYAGKQLVEIAEMKARLRAALGARDDPDFIVIARTDAVSVVGFDAALERASAYAESGADIIFVEAPTGREQLAAVPRAVPVAAMANMVEGGRTPIVPAAELQQMGYRLVIYPNAITRTVTRAALDMLAALQSEGSTLGHVDRMLSFGELTDLLGGGGWVSDLDRDLDGADSEEGQAG
jgi:2-methylisocitrate lyase-like PEP mutase family enzyme